MEEKKTIETEEKTELKDKDLDEVNGGVIPTNNGAFGAVFGNGQDFRPPGNYK